MYPEFIAIYVGLVVLVALAAANLVLLVKLLKRSETKAAAPTYSAPTYSAPTYTAPPVSGVPAAPRGDMAGYSGHVVFCKHCAAEFDASLRVCPRCGTPR